MTAPPAFAPEYLAEVKARTDMAALVGSRVRLSRRGRGLVGCCPFHDDSSPSFTVFNQRYRCFGCDAKGDAIGFVMATEGLRFFDAVCRLAIDAGMMELVGARSERKPLAPIRDAETPEHRAAEKIKGIQAARALWRASEPATGTLAEIYWQFRGMRRPLPSTVLFHPAPPAMLLTVKDSRGRVAGVHRTFVRRDGRGKADIPKPKMMRGQCWGGAYRFTPAARWLTLGEGFETTASVLEAAPRRAAWAALSLGNIAGGGASTGERVPHPSRPGIWLPSVEPDMARPGIVLPPIVKRLTLLRDTKGDQATTDALLRRAAERFTRLGVMVEIASPPDGCGDFNDALRLGSTTTARAAIRAALAAAEVY